MNKLDCVVQSYAWGDTDSIPSILGLAPTGEPQAELWMGAHPVAPSLLNGIPLNEVVAATPETLLGADITDEFGQLPYLFKVLAAAQPLSIQAHPSLEQAKVGFAREDAAGIERTAANRTYRDANHKPELICALTPFVAKCGFRNLAETRDLFDLLTATLSSDAASGLPDLQLLSDMHQQLNGSGSDAEILSATLAWLLRLPSDSATNLVSTVVDAAAALPAGSKFDDEALWTDRINSFFPGDIGVVVALLLNHLVLEPGEAVFLAAGNLHAYLQGTGMELMANSDNVVRGGCTPKHIDVEELLAVVDCTPIDPPIQRATSGAHTFESPVREFSLSRYEPTAEASSITPASAEILMTTAGTATIANANETIDLAQGEVAFIAASDGPYELTGNGTVFRATIGA